MLGTNGEWKQFYKANNKANLQFSPTATLTMQFNIVITILNNIDNLLKDIIHFRHMAQRFPKLEMTWISLPWVLYFMVPNITAYVSKGSKGLPSNDIHEL